MPDSTCPRRTATAFVLLTAGLLAGCQATAQHRNSSVVDYLYPETRNLPVSTEVVPRLTLPLRVGIAFTPGGDAAALTETSKAELLAGVRRQFETLDFVEAIEIVPTAYLRPGGSFENLEQLQRMFRVDVIALLSYDQTRFTDEGFASLGYWTLVGAYLIPGEKNSTHTLLDAAVYDIASRRMLLRAAGSSSVRSSATPVNLSEQVRADALAGFAEASASLSQALQEEIGTFKARLQQAPDDVEIALQDGYRGSGAGGWWLAVFGLGALIAMRRSRG